MAVEERVDADLRLGRHVELVAELEGLVREHPLRERLRAQQMLALYRSGRQADALESFRDARRSLVDELGLEPGRELRELEQAILAQDPALDRPRARARRAGAGRASPRPRAHRRGRGAGRGGRPRRHGAELVGRRRRRAARLRRRDRSRERPGRRGRAGRRPARDGRGRRAARSGSPTSRTAPSRRSTSASGASSPRSRRASASKRSPSEPAPPGSPTAGAAGPCAWTPTWATWRSRCGSRRRRRPASAGTRRAAALGRGSLWVASAPLAAVLRVDTRTRRVSGRVDVGNDPAGLAVGARRRLGRRQPRQHREHGSCPPGPAAR